MTRRPWTYGTAALVIVALAAGVEFAMGRVLMCRCGYIKFWHGVVQSAERSTGPASSRLGLPRPRCGL